MIRGRTVETGQRWETKDLRDKGRQVRVDRVDGGHAHVTTTVAAPGRPDGRGRPSRIGIVEAGANRTLKGFRLVRNADGSPAGAQ